MDDRWPAWCRSNDLQVEGDSVVVQLAPVRRHRVHVAAGSDQFEMSAIVVSRSIATSIDGVALRAWRLNRNASLVSFRIDRRGRLVGESWAPFAGLTPEEFRFTLRNLAQECDRIEYVLTGEDQV